MTYDNTIPDEERKKRGVYYTPRDMALQLAGPLVDHLLSLDLPRLRICDPCCGSGILLEATAEKLVERGFTREEAEGTLYGVDLDEEACEIARENLPGADIRQGNALIGDLKPPSQPSFLEGTVDKKSPYEEHFENPEELNPVDFHRGFDAVISNPPFIGNRRVRGALGDEMVEWLRERYNGGRIAELCGTFFRRATELAEEAVSLITTNTLTQGAERKTFILPALEDGWVIQEATSHKTWPGERSVTVHLMHLVRNPTGEPTLDGEEVERISSHLDPYPDSQLEKRREDTDVYQGMILSGDFAVDPSDVPPEERDALALRFNNNSIQKHVEPTETDVILDLHGVERAEEYEWCMQYLDGEWEYGCPRKRLREVRQQREEELWIGRVGKHWVPRRIKLEDFTFRPLPTNDISVGFYPPWKEGIIASFLFEILMRRFGSSMEKRYRFTPTHILPYFPWPAEGGEVGEIWKELHDHRISTQEEKDWTPTELYNLYNNPQCEDPEVDHLRELHVELFHEVLEVYGWEDLKGEWIFGSPWIDGTTRWVPEVEVREAILGRIGEL